MAQHLCGKLLEGREVSDETRHWILMALREALANAIKHGNLQNAAKRVDVEMEVVGDTLQIRIRDEGTGFEPQEVADPLAPENRLKTSGRGILLYEDVHDARAFRRSDRGAWRSR